MSDIPELLKARFQSVMSETSFSLFITLIAYAERFETDGDDIICFFPETEDRSAEENKLTIGGPISKDVLVSIRCNITAEYAAFLSVCGSMLLGESGTSTQLALTIGFEGTLHHLGKDILTGYTGKECSPIDIGLTAFYFFKPDNLNQLFISDGSKSLVKISNDPVEIYFRELQYEFSDHFKEARHRHHWLEG